MNAIVESELLPGAHLAADKLPGHWLLARLGKRVLRPGGLALTKQMLEALEISSSDSVVEFAPGLGITARLALAHRPAAYTAIEQDETAAALLRPHLRGPRQECRLGSAAASGLDSQSTTVVYAEAVLTMQDPARKAAIVREAARLLKPGGRFALHEMCLRPDDLAPELSRQIQQQLSHSIRVGARPLTASGWRALLKS